VIHTVHPVTQKRTELYMELAVGLGETLVSGAAAGSPYRLVYNKKSSRVETTTFASFDRAILPISGSMPKSSSTSTSGFISDSGLTSRPIDYSRVGLSTDRSYRVDLCRRLGKVGAHIEKRLERAQDVEGVVCEDRIYVVQSRAQQGLGAMEHGR
jgi:phosphoenolpyruvate synthase/pyruvate phosphate dikinase